MNSPRNILFVSHYPTMKMGGQRSMAGLIEHLDRERFRPLAVTTEPGELTDRLLELDCPVYHLPLCGLKLPNIRKVLSNAGSFRRLFRSEKIAIVHPDAERDAALCGVAKLGTGTRMVWHVRTTGRNNLDRHCLRFSDGVIGVSDAVMQRFPHRMLRGKYRTIPNGIDVEGIHPIESAEERAELRRELGMPRDRFALLYAGQVRPEKGVYEAVETMAALKDRLPPGEMPLLHVAGEVADVEVEKAIRKFVEETGLGDDVKMIGYRNDLQRVLPAYDVLILPSHGEGMSRIAVEAMAAGVVPVVSNVPGLSETVKRETGALVPLGDVESFADAVRELQQDAALRAELRENGIRRARQHYDVRAHARAVQEFYDEVLGGKLDVKS